MFLSIPSPRILLTGLFLAAAGLSSCEKKEAADIKPVDAPIICPEPGDCSTPATVRDLTGLDGCGKVLELSNGTRLEPTGPLWSSFNSTDGLQVLVGYRPISGGSICMVGQLVEVTCIRTALPNPNN